MATNLVARYLALKPIEIEDHTRDSLEWFKDNLRQIRMTDAGRKGLLAEGRKVANMEEGKIHMFFYDAKHKEKLPYYDRFPLVFPIGPASGGFLGLNMHYLPPMLRARLMDALYDTVTNKKLNRNSRIRASYDTLQAASKFNLFKPTIKHYLNSHVRSRFIYIEPSEWDIALFLPSAQWTKADAATVYADSRRKIRG